MTWCVYGQICEDAVADVVLFPCGHLSCCTGCMDDMTSAGHTECPICRRPVAQTKRVYVA